MRCPVCEHQNSESNRFCGTCGARLQSSDSRYPRDGYDSVDGEPRAELSRELIEFDKKIPIIAKPGTDRRQNVPPEIRETVRQMVARDRSLESGERRSERAEAEAAKHTVPVEKVAEHVEEVGREHPKAIYGSMFDLSDAVETKPNETYSVSGPSILGIGSSPAEFEYDDEEVRESHTRRNLALLVLLALIGLGIVQWKSIRDSALPFIKNGSMMVKIRSKMGAQQEAQQQQQAAANDPANNGAPKVEVAPTNENLKQNTPPTSTNTQANAQNAAGATTPNNAAANNSTAQNATPQTTAQNTPPQQPSSAEPSKVDGKDKAGAENDVSASAEEPASGDEEAATKNAKGIPQSDPPVSRAAKSKSTRTAERQPASEAGAAELAQASNATDPETQAAWLWRAVRQGNSEASVRLADMYSLGRGVPQNCDQAMVLLRSAAAHRNAQARGKLGAMYATGKCVEQDRVQAYHWMSLALEANPNSEWTARYRQSLWAQMSSAERQRAGGRP